MLRFTRRVPSNQNPSGSLTLPLDKRVKSRLRVTLDDGTEAGLFLDRGTTLRDGDRIVSEDGISMVIRAATEAVSTVRSDDPLLLARAAYHLGNRDIPLCVRSVPVSICARKHRLCQHRANA